MFVIDVPNLSIRQTYFSGQALTWERYDNHADHTRYTIQHGDRLLGVAQRGNRLILNCDEDDFFNIWYDYLDIGTDYVEINRSLCDCMGYMREFAEYASGVHLLNQGVHESVLASVLMYRQTISNAKRLMRWLCENIGEESRKLVKGIGSIKYFTIPTAEQIYDKFYLIGETFFDIDEPTDQQALDMCTMDLLRCYVYDCHDDIFGESIAFLRSDEQLMCDLNMCDWLPEPKVRERVALHAFGRRGIFPKSNYLRNKVKKYTRMDLDLFVDWYLQESEYKGYASQYVLYKMLNPIERQDRWAW